MSTSQKQAARKFVERWTFRRGGEKGEAQQFWDSLLGEVLGMEDVASRVQYQMPVPMTAGRCGGGFADILWKTGRNHGKGN